jgi:pyrimidine deaminase RibD-like protein
MDKNDFKFMQETIDWADACHPAKDGIPKVGAVIVAGGKAIGRGRRGTGKEGDDDHAELNAIRSVSAKDAPSLAGATLYTTLEPCTPDVRSKGEQCCSELIYQHKFKKVFVGILDPNRGVTGKGLLRLQESNVEVALFPHEFSQRIQAQNAVFIRTQQTWGATIIQPKERDYLRTYENGGKHTVQFTCLNPPGDDDYLLVSRGGLYWSMPGPFRHVKEKTWEIDAYFGGTGDHVLNLVTANNLGKVLFRYYRKIVEQNQARRGRLRGKVDPALLGGDYPGIEMNGLQKGLRLEHSVAVFVGMRVVLGSTLVEPTTISRDKAVKITYEIECFEDIHKGIWLGASFQDVKTKRIFYNTNEDKAVALKKGKNTCHRTFTIPKDAPLGEHMLGTNVWLGGVGNSDKSVRVASRPPTRIKIV